MQIRDFLGLSQDYTSNPCIFEVKRLGYCRTSLRETCVPEKGLEFRAYAESEQHLGSREATRLATLHAFELQRPGTLPFHGHRQFRAKPIHIM